MAACVKFNLLLIKCMTKYASGLTYVQIRHRLPTSQVERKHASYGNDTQYITLGKVIYQLVKCRKVSSSTFIVSLIDSSCISTCHSLISLPGSKDSSNEYEDSSSITYSSISSDEMDIFYEDTDSEKQKK